MELKDVIHHYLGCQVLHAGKVFIVRAINEKSEVLLSGCSDTNWIHITACKPLFRKLSSMTEEEAKELVKLSEDGGEIIEVGSIVIKKGWKDVQYLLSKYFDLFGLIESKQAIDINSADK